MGLRVGGAFTDVLEEQREAACDGRRLIQALEAARQWLKGNSTRINLLNVYPVPDGDTGTNMLLTVDAALAEANRGSAGSVGEVALAIYKGALMGARGNSGVILSQMLRGVADALAGKDALASSDLVNAFRQASEAAYRGVTNPVEGTMLTVIRDIARATGEVASQGDHPLLVLHQALSAGRESVARTPELLDVLRDAGVVDAGGEGLCVILEGMLRHLKGEPVEGEPPAAEAPAATAEISSERLRGYCTEFLIAGQDLDVDGIRAKMISLGDSVLAVGDRQLVHVHLHTTNPGVALEYGLASGELHRIKIDNLEDQHGELRVAWAESKKGIGQAGAINGISFVAVANGDGLVEVFKSLGVAEVVRGGDSINPSTGELLAAVERAPSGEVILLPNDRNVVRAAEQVKSLARKHVEVVPTETMPQGIAALIAFNYQDDLSTNAGAMRAAAEATTTIKVARATRQASVDGIPFEKGQVLGMLNGKVAAAGGDDIGVILALLAKADLETMEIITIYHGNGVDGEQAEPLAQAIRRSHPNMQVDVVFGGQPFYDYILSVE